jgi:hypothetical protein
MRSVSVIPCDLLTIDSGVRSLSGSHSCGGFEGQNRVLPEDISFRAVDGTDLTEQVCNK